jgi:ribosomal protein S18 acetylase RimI-like enzyme
MNAVARITYFKRYRMELRLADIPPLEMPRGFRWIPWNRDLIDTHAHVLYDSFHQEIDAKVFPSLGDLLGCHVLMQEICRKPFFVPEATWLLAAPDGTPCASIQGLQERCRGAIQNVGVLPEYRGRGVGSALILQALHGFRRLGLAIGSLEVTDRNEGAIRLYRRHGFRKTRTLYRAVAAEGSEIRETDDPRDWQDYDYD